MPANLGPEGRHLAEVYHGEVRRGLIPTGPEERSIRGGSVRDVRLDHIGDNGA
jgi:hypothetical protein